MLKYRRLSSLSKITHVTNKNISDIEEKSRKVKQIMVLSEILPNKIWKNSYINPSIADLSLKVLFCWNQSEISVTQSHKKENGTKFQYQSYCKCSNEV